MTQIRNQKLLNQVAQRIKELRAERDLTQEQVYNDTNIHVARIEAGKVNVSVSTLHALCEFFGVSLEEFFRGIA